VNYLSVCSGIEAATVAWHHTGWKPVGFSEIEKFPSQVLKHHYPEVTNYGDMTKYKEWNINEPIELLVGGTPCQSFSVAGLRKGLADPRGNLALVYLGIADHFKPKWIVWENVPGVLSSSGGRDFGAFLGALEELGYGFAYRVLDAQYFGVPQRRRRVFVIGCLGDWRSAAAVLFEPESLSGNPAPSRSEGKEVAPTITRGFGDRGLDLDQISGGGYQIRHNSVDDVAQTLTKSPSSYSSYNPARQEGNAVITYSLAGNTIGRQPTNGGNGEGFNQDVSYTLTKTDVHAVAFPIDTQNMTEGHASGGKGYGEKDDPSFTLTKGHHHAVAFGIGEKPDIAHCLRSGASKADKHESTTYIKQSIQIRRLMPIECERLQGFPDNYTNITTASDSARYKALGNSMAVPVMKWIGQRINFVDSIK
jgi:DNA (cytosine-5)-methyltransferase 1